MRLQLFTLAYNLANFLRSLAFLDEAAHWSLTTLREKLMKIGAQIVRHGRWIRLVRCVRSRVRTTRLRSPSTRNEPVFGGYRANSEGGKFEAEPPRHFRNALAWLGMSVEDLPGASLRDWPA